MNYNERHEKAWKCWLEIMKKIETTESYIAFGHLHITKGCGGDFVNIIEKYL